MENTFFEAKYPADSRAKEIEQILSFLKEGSSCQIISAPGAGRSTLLGLLAYNKTVREYHLKKQKDSYHFVMVSFAEIRNKNTTEALKLIFLDIVASLEDRPLDGGYEKVKQILNESISLNDGLVLFQGLKKTIDFLIQERGLHVVLFFDEFDTYIPMITSEFFVYLATLRNRAKYKFSIVFSSYKPLEDILEPSLLGNFAEFIQGHTIYLSLFDKASLSFRISYIEKVTGKTLDKKVQDELLSMTTGHAKLTRLAVETTLQHNNEAIEQLNNMLPIQKALEDIWQSLSPAEQTHMLKNLFPSVLDDEHSQYLKKIGLMTDESITIPLFEAFAEEKKREQKKDSATLLTEISDKLTATEFRLLQFFLKNPNAILERNTIIENVWLENKSMAGVSDQALDQIIFRLRKKIEEDPNAPTHIQTVKGRGFKFAP